MASGIQHVFIIGSKGIPARYGGFETFVEKLTEHQASRSIRYHVACAVDEMPDVQEFEHNGAHCYNIRWRPIGAAKAITYDLDALKWALGYIERNGIEHPIIYILACRIGPFIGRYAKRIHELGGKLFVNPDGHEWLRAKWSAPVKRYWKLSEKGMVRHADLVICDSLTIEAYIRGGYARYAPQTTYIAYGADTRASALADDDPAFTGWLAEKGLAPFGYYLIVGRFVPENNYEAMIGEFMASDTEKSLAIVTDARGPFLDELEAKLHLSSDPRVKLVGTVYDQELLKKIRESAFAYIHGHEVGGTNPSLLEALASTQLNLLLDVGFNREVAEDAALYWDKERGSLRGLVSSCDEASSAYIAKMTDAARCRISDLYSWERISSSYEQTFASSFEQRTS